MDKMFYLSRTFWLGAITLIVSLLTFFQGEAWIVAYPQIVAAIGSAIGVLTIVLRFLTSTPITPTKR